MSHVIKQSQSLPIQIVCNALGCSVTHQDKISAFAELTISAVEQMIAFKFHLMQEQLISNNINDSLSPLQLSSYKKQLMDAPLKQFKIFVNLHISFKIFNI
jgi:hypothetical protein